MKPQLILFLTLSLLCIGTGAALAQTPDGETPAEETVCNTETGAAYGLCNAYCEAMDCETDNPSASATACTRVQDKFQQITGRDLPCEAVTPATCPCQGIDDFDTTTQSPETCTLGGLDRAITLFVDFGLSQFTAFSSSASAPQPRCGYIEDQSGEEILLSITSAEAAGCIQLLQEAAASRNLTCN
jgi:hypothetical protein